jgi:hypothetical protein
MSANSRKLKEKAEEFVTQLGNDIRDIDREIIAVNDLSDLLNAQKEDAKWAGDTDKLDKIKYALVVNNHKRRVLMKQHRKIMRETAAAAADPAAIREAALREAADVVHKWWFSEDRELPQELILALIGEKK